VEAVLKYINLPPSMLIALPVMTVASEIVSSKILAEKPLEKPNLQIRMASATSLSCTLVS